MDLQQFDVLEKKVAQIVANSVQLKSENAELRRRLQELEALNQQTTEQLRLAREAIDKMRGSHDDATTFKEREEKIRGKIEHMLAKLEELQLQS